MGDRAIVFFGMEQSLNAPPTHAFWIYLTEQQRVLPQAFFDHYSASQQISKEDAAIDEEWTKDQVSSFEDVVAVNAETGAFAICITLYRNGRVAPNEEQPAHRFWIFLPDGRRIATRSRLAEALAYIGVQFPTSSGPDEAPRSKSAIDKSKVS